MEDIKTRSHLAYDLEERLVKFSGEIIKFTKTVTNDYAGNNLKIQIIRSATSSALNYGEAQAAESRKDFRHKNKLVLKELKESRVNLKILNYIGYGDQTMRKIMLNECGQLIAIFATIIKNTIDQKT
ncbi:MAG: four helix bundle protein [Chitinophagales bacterium]